MFWQAPYTVVIDTISVLLGSSGQVNVNPYFGTSTLATDHILSSSTPVTNTSSPYYITSFANGTIPINNMVWFQTTYMSGNPSSVTFQIKYHYTE